MEHLIDSFDDVERVQVAHRPLHPHPEALLRELGEAVEIHTESESLLHGPAEAPANVVSGVAQRVVLFDKGRDLRRVALERLDDLRLQIRVAEAGEQRARCDSVKRAAVVGVDFVAVLRVKHLVLPVDKR